MRATLTILLCTLLIAGCGTFSTTFTSDKSTKRALTKHDTYCSKLPRIYSGVSYDFCKLHSEPHAYLEDVIILVAVDVVLSGVLDTVVLPHTIIQQINKGNLDLKTEK